MSLLNRIKAFFDTLQTKWSEDPAARGAAKITLGAALIAEGVFGFTRSSRSSFSLFGSFALGVGAAVFIVAGLFASPDTYSDEVQVQGEISDMIEGRDSDKNHSYKSVYSYNVNGKTYTMTSSISSSKRPTLGSPVKIVYSAAQPRNAYRADGADAWFSWIFIGSGFFLAAWASISLVISLMLIAGGIYLFRSGRKDRLSVGEKSNFFK
ncbi:MAG TPA: DUF3592 domain-containing protein, partial [Pseudomonadales bacterium]|nr:DUF3592 domain-containing protein [Pseudomonadales bacterium]